MVDEEEDADFLNGVIGELISSSKRLLQEVFSVESKIEFDRRGKRRKIGICKDSNISAENCSKLKKRYDNFKLAEELKANHAEQNPETIPEVTGVIPAENPAYSRTSSSRKFGNRGKTPADYSNKTQQDFAKVAGESVLESVENFLSENAKPDSAKYLKWLADQLDDEKSAKQAKESSREQKEKNMELYVTDYLRKYLIKILTNLYL